MFPLALLSGTVAFGTLALAAIGLNTRAERRIEAGDAEVIRALAVPYDEWASLRYGGNQHLNRVDEHLWRTEKPVRLRDDEVHSFEQWASSRLGVPVVAEMDEVCRKRTRAVLGLREMAPA